MDFAEYEALGLRVIADFKTNPTKYVVWDDVCQHLVPGVDEFEAVNRNVMIEAAAHLKLKAAGFFAAMKRRQKELDAQIKAQDKLKAEQAHEARCGATFGGMPGTARDAVWMFVNHNGVSVRFDGTCYSHRKETLSSAIEGSILLAAEALGLTLGETRIMSNAALKLAWSEFLDAAREERKDVVWQHIEATDRVTAAKALAQLRDLCDKLFIEPEFADASIRKWIWQVKRRLQRMYVKDLHFLLFRGQQGTGKTELCREIMRPVQEVACETSLAQMLDEKNWMTRSMFVGFPDEMARAERTDLNEVKSLVTGETSTSRVLYSHHSQRNPVNLSLLGTADKPISEMMSDMAGMRRFVEVITKPKHMLNLDWEQEVVALPWADIWRAVDHTAVDPLMSVFGDLLREKQDAMRRRSNVEAWLESSWADDYDPKKPVPQRKEYVAGEYVEFAAKPLYTGSFRIYEETYHPGSKATSLTSWGTKMKEMINAGSLPRWSYRHNGSNVLYRYALTEHQPVTPSQSTGLMVLHPSKSKAL